jgi:hypothetical protein
MARAEYNGAHPRLRCALLAVYAPGWTPCFLCGEPMCDPPSLLDLAHGYPRSDPRRHSGPRGPPPMQPRDEHAHDTRRPRPAATHPMVTTMCDSSLHCV